MAIIFFYQGYIKEPICMTHISTTAHMGHGVHLAIDGCVTGNVHKSMIGYIPHSVRSWLTGGNVRYSLVDGDVPNQCGW